MNDKDHERPGTSIISETLSYVDHFSKTLPSAALSGDAHLEMKMDMMYTTFLMTHLIVCMSYSEIHH